jgi:cobalamin biosynthesis protein CobD/CbiB
MTKISKASIKKQKLEQAISLLKFVLDLDDEEIVKSAIESVIESLEEIAK